VIVDGAYALHSTLRSLLDIRVAVVKMINLYILVVIFVKTYLQNSSLTC
jgi:hypothetical protein